jgi:hypothetical protein
LSDGLRDPVSGEEGTEPRPAEGEVTRRGLLGGAGGVAAGGLLVLGLPEAAEAARRRTREVAAGRTDRHTVGFLGRIAQVGPKLTAVGYVTRARGLRSSALFTRPPGRTSNDPRAADSSAARITFFCEATIESLSTVGSVITAIAGGRLRFFYQRGGGARFDDPGSFARGREIATFAAAFQNNLALEGQDRAGVALSGDLTQRRARRFQIQGRPVRFGHRGLPWSLEATGRGQRTERSTPRSEIFVSGELEVVDAARRR